MKLSLGVNSCNSSQTTLITFPKKRLSNFGRISCMVAAENDIDVSAVVCLGYPLKVCVFCMLVFGDFEFLVYFVGLHTSLIRNHC